MVSPELLKTNTTLVTRKANLPGMVEDILQLQPQTTNIVVVFGASTLERFWVDVCRREFQEHGISVVVDFVFNHTSDEHEWALRTLQGDPETREYYRTFPDRILNIHPSLLPAFPGAVKLSQFQTLKTSKRSWRLTSLTSLVFLTRERSWFL